MTRTVQVAGEQFQTDEGEGGQALRWPIVVEESALPDGASTSALQTSVLAAIVAVGVTVIAILAVMNNHVPTIAWPHARIHAGASFTANTVNEVSSIGEMTMIAFNAPPSNEVHLTVSVESTHEANVYIYRDTSLDNGEGTQVQPVNRNQMASIGVSTVTSIEATPTTDRVTVYNEAQAADANLTTTTELEHMHLIGGSGPLAVGATGTSREEWIFTDGTQIAIVLVAATNDGATHIVQFDFYEE